MGEIHPLKSGEAMMKVPEQDILSLLRQGHQQCSTAWTTRQLQLLLHEVKR